MKKILILFISAILLNPIHGIKAQGWASMGLSYPSLVWVMADYSSFLQVGGLFSSPNEIRAMAEYNGDFYAGGFNGGSPSAVFKNGNSIGLTSGQNVLKCFVVYNGELYVAGGFDSINGVAANNIAKWNGTTWSPAGAGIGGGVSLVHALCVFNNELYAGGDLGIAAKWNNSSWSYIGSFTVTGSSSLIRGLGVYNGSLYAGGFFDHVDGVNAVNLAKLTGTGWTGAGDIGIAGDPSYGVSALTEYNGELYCGGSFLIAGGVAANNMARFNGTSWSALGSGTNGVVTCLLDYNQGLIAGGGFTTAGGISVDRIAQWNICSAVISAGGPVSFCAGNSVLLSTAATGTTYQWQLNNVNIAGATSSSYTVTVSGNYRCHMNGCSSSFSNSIGVTVNPLPGAGITPSGSLSFCSGGSILLNAVTAPSRSYQWRKNGVDIAGAISSNYTALSAGTYKVRVTNTLTGCSKTSGTGTQITVYSIPAATATPQGPTTFCAGDSVLLKANYNNTFSYQWKKNGTNISGATTNKCVAKIAGNYKVKVTNANGCTNISNVVSVSVPCREEETLTGKQNTFDAIVFPNPSAEDFVFEIQNTENNMYLLEMFDVTGRMIFRIEDTAPKILIPGDYLLPGIYEAIILCGNKNRTLRVIKSE